MDRLSPARRLFLAGMLLVAFATYVTCDATGRQDVADFATGLIIGTVLIVALLKIRKRQTPKFPRPW